MADAIADDGGTAIGVEADVTDEDAVTALVDTTVEEFDVDAWREVVEVDRVGTFIGCRAAGRRVIEWDDGGAILNVSSLMGGDHGLQLRSPYCASKAGVNNLTRTLAVEWAEHDVHVNALAPGFVWTEVTDQTQDSGGYTDDDVRDRTPLDRFGTVEEMAECALFLVGRNDFITGEVLYADGGGNAHAWGADS